MKINLIMWGVVLGGSLLFGEAVAQNEMTQADYDRRDSLRATYEANEAKSEKMKNEESLNDLKDERKDTKSKAKEAQRIERDANDAARESRNAYRTEKKAQKMRKQADKQAEKAAKARTKSDSN